MSGTTAYVLTEQQKTDIRRLAGYPVVGNGYTGMNTLLFYPAYQSVEYRLLNMTQTEGSTLVSVYLTNLLAMEQAIFTAQSNLDTSSAAVWKHNDREMIDRENVFRRQRLRLCQYLGIRGGPALEPGYWQNAGGY